VFKANCFALKKRCVKLLIEFSKESLNMNDVNPQASLTAQPANNDEKLWALIAHLSGFVFAIISPILILVLHKNILNYESAFVTHHAKQALYWQIAGIIVGILTCGIGALVMLIFAVIAALEANKGEWYQYPVTGKMAKG